MSLLSVPFVRFPLVASSPTCSLSRPSASSTNLAVTRSNPCTSAHWSGMSGCLANPTPHTGYEPNFCTFMNEEHTPINLADSHRNFPRRGDATIISTTEDPEGFQHSGASSSSKLTAASIIPTVLGSLGNKLWKQWRDCESADSRNGMQEPGANLDRESVVSTLVSSQSKGKRDRDKNVVHSLRDNKSPQNPWTESWLGRPRRENGLSRNCMKLKQKLRRGIGKREILTSLFRRSIRSLNLNDCSFIKQVDGQIRHKETKSVCMENWNWEIDSSKKILQEIANKL